MPTWLVVQRHIPIEHDKNEAIGESQSRDEEQGVVQSANVAGKGA